MAKILICYYSKTHHTEHMAEAVAEGVRQVDKAEPEVRTVDQVAPQDLASYDGVILGSPVYYGSMAGEIKTLLDRSITIHGKLVGKVGGAFASSANVGGGNESAIMHMLQALLIHGCVVQGSVMGDHYGAVAVGDLDDRSRRQCYNHGRMIAELAVKLHG